MRFARADSNSQLLDFCNAERGEGGAIISDRGFRILDGQTNALDGRTDRGRDGRRTLNSAYAKRFAFASRQLEGCDRLRCDLVFLVVTRNCKVKNQLPNVWFEARLDNDPSVRPFLSGCCERVSRYLLAYLLSCLPTCLLVCSNACLACLVPCLLALLACLPCLLALLACMLACPQCAGSVYHGCLQ